MFTKHKDISRSLLLASVCVLIGGSVIGCGKGAEEGSENKETIQAMGGQRFKYRRPASSSKEDNMRGGNPSGGK